MSTYLKTDTTLPAGPSYAALFNFLSPALPVSTGLVGQYLLGGNINLAMTNQVNSALPLTKVGTPVVNAIGSTLSQGNCFDTGLPETTDWTFIAVAKVPTSGSGAMMVSNFQNAGAPVGSSLYFPSTTQHGVAMGMTTSTNNLISQSLGTPATSYYGFCGRGSASSTKSVARLNTVLGTEASGSPTGHALSSRNIRIGGHYTAGSFSSNVDILFAAVWNTYLTDSERNSVFDYLDTFLTTQVGVTTL